MGIIFVVVGVIVVAIVCSVVLDRKRTAAFEEVANELGLSFDKDGHSALAGETSGFHLMDRGRSRRFRNVISAVTDDVAIRLFDYSYRTGGGKRSRTNRQTVALIHSPAVHLPSFRARKENALDTIGSSLGFQDIDFEDHPAFSDAYVLKSETEALTRDFFDDELLDFFVAGPFASFEANGHSFIFHGDRTMKPSELRELFETAFRVYAALRDRMYRKSEPRGND